MHACVCVCVCVDGVEDSDVCWPESFLVPHQQRFWHGALTADSVHDDDGVCRGQGSSFRSSASGSSCEVMPATTSTIDSGIHSTGEDTFPPRFLRNSRGDHK